jgi:hypothetical protein
MSATTLTTPLPPRTIPARRKFTIIPRLDESPKLVAQAQTASGKIAVIAMAVCLIGWRSPRPFVFLAAVALVSFFPAYRSLVLAAASFYWIMTSGLLRQDVLGKVAAESGVHAHPRGCAANDGCEIPCFLYKQPGKIKATHLARSAA